MSTRAIIARPVKDGYLGRYHHFDGYPSGLGAALYELATTQFKGKLDKMMTVLIDEHPAGWSTIMAGDGPVSNFKLKPGWYDREVGSFSESRPICYCHGQRQEEAQDYTPLVTSDCEYLYVINESKQVMFVHARTGSWDGPDQWRLLATVDLTGPEPDWNAMDN